MEKQKQQTAGMLRRVRDFRYALILEGAAVGAAGGLVSVLFRWLLQQADTLREQVGHWLTLYPAALLIVLAALLATALLVAALLKREPYISGSGIPQVEAEMRGAISQKWWRVLVMKLTGGLLSIGAGLSLGREGPSIQLGAMAGKGVARLSHRNPVEEKMLITCGASAGLAAAFNAPLAGVLFSLEELHKNFSTDVLLSAMSASITADFISSTLFGLGPVFDFSGLQMMPLNQYWTILLLGIGLGLIAALYVFCIGKSQTLYAKIPDLRWRLIVPFLLAGVLLIVAPELLGGGHALVEAVCRDQLWQALLLLFAGKFLFSMISFGSGAPGGIFLPMLVLGAVAGSICSQWLQLGGIPVATANFVILGMAGLFAAIVRAPLTGIILISEMTGSLSHLLTLSLVSLTAVITVDLLRCQPVYDLLLDRLLDKEKAPASTRKVLIDIPVSHGAMICGKTPSDLDVFSGGLIVAIQRHDQEIVPHGDTVIQAGDVLTLLCEEADYSRIHSRIEHLCKN